MFLCVNPLVISLCFADFYWLEVNDLVENSNFGCFDAGRLCTLSTFFALRSRNGKPKEIT